MALPPSLQVHAHFQPEEAAHAASELISSLDNLPGEVVFLLEEIREKDARINQLIQRINTRHVGLTKTAKNLSSSAPSNAQFNLPLSSGISNLPTSHLSQKESQALSKIQAEWIKVENLQEEKIKLAERMERIINRAKERAKFEWIKVGGKEIIAPPEDPLRELTEGGMGMGMGKPILSGLGEMGHSNLILPSTGLGTGSDGRPPKKRKPNHLSFPSPSASIAASLSSMPPPSVPGRARIHHSHNKHRLSSSVSALALNDPDADGELDEDFDMDADADGELDADAEGEEVDFTSAFPPGEGDTEADDTLYCICQQKSYGEMIGCDNDTCQYEWFHVKCVSISGQLPETWYCPDCVKKLGMLSSDGKMANTSRKGRKK
ncbi:uncharacterized protein I303_105352 [Kwoniella dejecticola CBS 10117]|uniref:Chromatin modification-related protein n=1 Tax=Kwoniella dejecticola CBS 10117 TaxID=1296121 RepID=A0A1A6A2R2_9TREE|nr:uncharacterized protein I303_05201 [Kwoniella dejecticola CBS 10117]OBR84343.1 hypothetical protein I303_05201 [Kwoniella dejecticola CBS 10117]